MTGVQSCQGSCGVWQACDCPPRFDAGQVHPPVDDPGPCARLTCPEGRAYCVVRYLQDGSACDDGDPCTEGDSCSADGCHGVAKECGDGEACTTDACDAVTGACVHVRRPDGQGCEEGDLCTIGDNCAGGVCQVGVPITCEDGDPCTLDSCEPSTGECARQPAPDGTACQDGLRCTIDDACVAGACEGGPPALDCDDDKPCTVDACDEQTGRCAHGPAPDGSPCDDTFWCTRVDTCRGGLCQGAGDPCDDDEPCTEDRCFELGDRCEQIPLDDGLRCDDGRPCSANDTCLDGQCLGRTPRCDDGDACTVGRCTLDGDGCETLPLPPVSSCCEGSESVGLVDSPEGECDDDSAAIQIGWAGECFRPTTSCAQLAGAPIENGRLAVLVDVRTRCIPPAGVTIDLRLDGQASPIGFGRWTGDLVEGPGGWHQATGLTISLVSRVVEESEGAEALITATVVQGEATLASAAVRGMITFDELGHPGCD